MECGEPSGDWIGLEEGAVHQPCEFEYAFRHKIQILCELEPYLPGTLLGGLLDAESAKTFISGVISSHWKGFKPSGGSLDDITSMIGRFAKGEITDVECNMRIRCIMTGDEDSCRVCSDDLDEIVGRALDENPSVIADYAKNEKAANRIIGGVMKETGGTYSSAEIVSAVRRLISERL